MFELLKAVVLGFVQGATEFIPVSSSGHLVIVPWLLGWEHASLLFDTVLHWGTLLAIFVVFWRDFVAMFTAAIGSIRHRSLADSNARLAWFVVIGSIPAAILGLLFKDFLEGLYSSIQAAGVALLVTAALLIASEQLTKRLQKPKSIEQLTLFDAIVIGIAQSFALLPGISRSGSTIAAGLTRGLQRETAARFSFLLGTPAFFGAGLLQVMDAMATDSSQLIAQLPVLSVGFIVSAITGFVAIRFLLAYLRNNNLYVFSTYCIIAGLSVLTLSFIW